MFKAEESRDKNELCVWCVTPSESSWEEPLKSETEINVSADQNSDKLHDELLQTVADAPPPPTAAWADFRVVFVMQS